MTNANKQDFTHATQLLRHGPFARFLYVRVAASIALQMQAVAVGWQMYALTGSSLALGLVGLVQFVPAVGFFLATGQAADRYDRRKVTAASQTLEALATAILAFPAAAGSPALILITTFVVGTGRAFELPSLQSVLTNIVPAHMLPRAIAASNSASQAAVVAGPALGGVLIEISPTWVFAICAVLWLSSALAMMSITLERTVSTRQLADLTTLFSGFVYIIRNKVVLGAITMDLFAVLLGSATALLPIFASDVFVAGPIGFGVLRAAPAIGAIGMALFLTRRPISHHVGYVMFISVAAYGVGTILLALTPNLVLAVSALMIVGAADTISMVIRQTLVQLHTPDEMQGRVLAVNSVFTTTSNQLGTFRAGLVAAAVGTIPAVLLGGISAVAVVLISAGFFRELMRADGYEPTEPFA